MAVFFNKNGPLQGRFYVYLAQETTIKVMYPSFPVGQSVAAGFYDNFWQALQPVLPVNIHVAYFLRGDVFIAMVNGMGGVMHFIFPIFQAFHVRVHFKHNANTIWMLAVPPSLEHIG